MSSECQANISKTVDCGHEVTGSNPVEASESFLGFLCNYFTYFTTVKITFTCILYPQFIYRIYITCTSSHELYQLKVDVGMLNTVND